MKKFAWSLACLLLVSFAPSLLAQQNGRIAGRVAVRRAHGDGADRVDAGVPPTGDGLWTGTNPVLPLAGTWRTKVASDGDEFQPEPPYAFGSAADLAEEAALSRLWGGIHFPHDNDAGLAVGARLGAKVVARMRAAASPLAQE